MKGLEITGESPLDTVFSHKDIGTVNISRMEASIRRPGSDLVPDAMRMGLVARRKTLRFLTPRVPVQHQN